MKLNHKFRLVPVDENSLKVDNVESDIDSLLRSKDIPDYKKMAIFESLIRQLQILKQELARPRTVRVENQPALPTIAFPTEKVPLSALKVDDLGQIVLNNQLIPALSLTDTIDSVKSLDDSAKTLPSVPTTVSTIKPASSKVTTKIPHLAVRPKHSTKKIAGVDAGDSSAEMIPLLVEKPSFANVVKEIAKSSPRLAVSKIPIAAASSSKTTVRKKPGTPVVKQPFKFGRGRRLYIRTWP